MGSFKGDNMDYKNIFNFKIEPMVLPRLNQKFKIFSDTNREEQIQKILDDGWLIKDFKLSDIQGPYGVWLVVLFEKYESPT